MNVQSNFIEKLDNREKERLRKLQETRKEKQDNICSNENVDNFLSNFGAMIDDIDNDMINEDLGNNENLTERLDDLCVKIHRATKYLSDSTLFLNSRVLEKSTARLKLLQDSYQKFKDKHLPKKKFAFRKKPVVVNKIEKAKIDLIMDVTDFSASQMYESDYLVKGKQNEVIIINPNDVNGKDVCMADMDKCEISVAGVANTIHITNCRDSVIRLGPVSTSVFLDECHNCTLKIACQQLRAHSSRFCKVYLHVSSRAIIEDCTGMLFGAYDWYYSGIEEDFEKAGLNFNKRNWSTVDDFNWLSDDKKSPNWDLINGV